MRYSPLKLIAELFVCIAILVGIVSILASVIALLQYPGNIWIALAEDQNLQEAILRTGSLFFLTTVISILMLMGFHIFVDELNSVLKFLFAVPFLTGLAVPIVAFFIILSPSISPISNGAISFFDLSDWLENPDKILWTIAIIDMWFWAPLIISLSYFIKETIPTSHFELAKLEGYNSFAQFKLITLPKLMPLLIAFVFVKCVDWLRTDEISSSLFPDGGPAQAARTLPFYIRTLYFEAGNSAYALSISFLTLAVVWLALRTLTSFNSASSFVPWREN